MDVPAALAAAPIAASIAAAALCLGAAAAVAETARIGLRRWLLWRWIRATQRRHDKDHP